MFHRHQNGVILSAFLRHRITSLDKNAPDLTDLFGATFDAPEYQAFRDELDHWLETDAGKRALVEAESLGFRLPSSLSYIALQGSALTEFFRGNVGRFAQEVHERWKIYSDKLEEAWQARNDKAQTRWRTLRERYMQQFLVNQLSQRSLIPTYSFPVHSLTLEVSREFKKQMSFGQDSEIALTRDASLGISEYAPNAEVVANGRIWRSDGLARYPRLFMPERYYAACTACHHVMVGEDMVDVGQQCENCGNSLPKVRAFIEPRGFVTAYDERDGKDPGIHRRRQRPADEARLITIPRPDQFDDSDHHSISCR